MEADAGGGPAEQPVAPAPAPAPVPASAPSTRGWTMFMEADVPSEPTAPAAEPEEPTEVAPEAQQSGASDSKGWTVFMERQPIAPPPGYTGPVPSYAPTAAELAETVEHEAQPPVEEVLAPSAEQSGVPKQTVVMDRAPEIPPPAREPSGSDVPAPVPSKPAIEAAPPRPQQPAPSRVPAPIEPKDLDKPPANKLPLYIGVGVGVVILIIIIIMAIK